MKLIRYDKNPFIREMMIPMKDKRIQLSRIGRDNNVLINQETGEINGTHITTFKKVDTEQFVKLFTANIALTFDLKSAGIKAFGVLMWTLQNKSITKDLIPLDKIALDEFLKEHDEKKIQLSQPTFWRGLNELEQAQIIAKHIRQGWYYINPNFVFNGDRIAFTNLYEKK